MITLDFKIPPTRAINWINAMATKMTSGSNANSLPKISTKYV